MRAHLLLASFALLQVRVAAGARHHRARDISPGGWDGSSHKYHRRADSMGSKCSLGSSASTSTPKPTGSVTSVAANSTTSANSTSSGATPTTTGNVTTCATLYSAKIQINGTGTLPKPTSFVQKDPNSQNLLLDNKPYRIVGPNIYWLCSDENVPGSPKGPPPSKGRIREALAAAVAMGANTIRVPSCGNNVGSPYSLEPQLNTFNYTNYLINDYVLFAAREYGLRVILPLTDNYQYYTGGKYTYLQWRNVSQENFGHAFYTNTQVVQDFKNYISHLVNRINTYTGVRYGDDPTVLAFETGNELGAYIGKVRPLEGYPPLNWTNTIAEYLHSLAPRILTLDGSDGFRNYSTNETSPSLNVRTDILQMMTDHMYPPNVPVLQSEVPLATKADKNFLIGKFCREWDWTEKQGGNNLTYFLDYIESIPYMGDMIWSLFGHDDQCCAWIKHDDGYSMYYPNGNEDALNKNQLKVVQHWYKVTNRTVPTELPGVACPQPVF
ncbi:glycoside hydrolase [Meredithblackwellia eburnea MCA 4105]